MSGNSVSNLLLLFHHPKNGTGTILAMLKKIINMGFHLVVWLIIGILILFGLPKLITELSSAARIHSPDDAPESRVAIVFGAGLLRDGTPSPVLKDRVAAAVRLYKAGKVEKILMSGDNRFEYYNEPASMQSYAVELGIPEEDIVLDYAGRRTYDTCYRARSIFGLSNAVLVTQRYHLPRAIFTCRGLGLDAQGVMADLREYSDHSLWFWNLRELPASLVAVWQVWVTQPEPVLGDPEPIFPEVEGK